MPKFGRRIRDVWVRQEQLDHLENRMRKIEEQLWCLHRKTTYERAFYAFWSNPYWTERCTECGLVIRGFDTEREWREAERLALLNQADKIAHSLEDET